MGQAGGATRGGVSSGVRCGRSAAVQLGHGGRQLPVDAGRAATPGQGECARGLQRRSSTLLCKCAQRNATSGTRRGSNSRAHKGVVAHERLGGVEAVEEYDGREQGHHIPARRGSNALRRRSGGAGSTTAATAAAATIGLRWGLRRCNQAEQCLRRSMGRQAGPQRRRAGRRVAGRRLRQPGGSPLVLTSAGERPSR